MARDTKSKSLASFQSWRGTVDRLEPCITPDKTFSFAENILFGLQGCAERISGKKTSIKHTSPVLSVYPLTNDLICIQTLADLRVVPVTDL